jgi:glutamate-1-semialdehyde aminotransferase
MREKIFKLAMLREGFNTFHGYGAISTAHSEEEIQASVAAVERIADAWKTAALKY